MGIKIRTMWMTPFYLFFGVLVIYIFQSKINLNKLKDFTVVFLILFIFSPFAYAYVSITQTNKRTDYPGREIAENVQKQWNEKKGGKILYVFGNEWEAGNLSYRLKDRPIWQEASGNKKNWLNYMPTLYGKTILCRNKKENEDLIACLEYKNGQLEQYSHKE